MELFSPSNDDDSLPLPPATRARLRPCCDGLVADDKLRFEVTKLKGGFEGTLDDERRECSGTWSQPGGKFPLRLKKVDKPSPRIRPQEPERPYPYDEDDLIFENAADGVRLAGTLTLPRGDETFPAVVLITGSGAQDRDQTVMGHKPFWVIADHLTRNGIAVLRYDDRGVGGSTGSIPQSTDEDFAEDALAAVATLKTHSKITPDRIGLLGRSVGGIIAPHAASRSNDVAFVIMLAGPTIPGEELLYVQGELVARAAGRPDDVAAWNRSLQERLFQRLKENEEFPSPEEVDAMLDKHLEQVPDRLKSRASKMKPGLRASVQAFLNPWFRYYLLNDPRPELRRVKCPVLALFGEKDVQVPPDPNHHEAEKALQQAGNPDFTIKTLPGINHLFQSCETGAVTEYIKIDETINAAVLDMLTAWIKERF